MLRRIRERFARNPIPEGWERSVTALRALRPRSLAYRDRIRLMAVETRLHNGLQDVVTRALRDLGLSPSEIIGMAL